MPPASAGSARLWRAHTMKPHTLPPHAAQKTPALSGGGLCMTHISHRSRYDTSSHSVMDTAHRASRTPGDHARRSPAVVSARQRYHSCGAGFPPACRLPRCRRQVMDAAAGAQDGRLPHGLARRPPRPRPIRRSALPRRVMRAKALPDRVQALPGLSGSARGARSPPSDQPCRGFHGVRQGLNPPTCQPVPPASLPHAGYA